MGRAPADPLLQRLRPREPLVEAVVLAPLDHLPADASGQAAVSVDLLRIDGPAVRHQIARDVAEDGFAERVGLGDGVGLDVVLREPDCAEGGETALDERAGGQAQRF